MMKMNLMNLLEKAMDGSVLRHNVLNNNITNANTPGFKRSDVNFRSSLDEAMKSQLKLKTTRPVHFKSSTIMAGAKIIHDQTTSLRSDGNNIDIDIELANLAENNLYFNSLAHFLSSQLALLRQSISEGRR
ncbi:MAG: flagellar basal body rod protein FlgB [Peptococcia bacterium]|jgi:flagellar basal-body rod protein FlgB